MDHFKLMPGLTESEKWVEFLDWNGSGHLDIQKVCFAVAALLPVNDAYARKFVLQVMNLPPDSKENHELNKTEVINTLLPQIRRQLRRLVQSPRPRPPQICRNSKQDELVTWFHFWDSKKQGFLDVSTLTLAVVTTFHTALAKSADAPTKDAVAHTFLTELGLRETGTVTESEFLEKMAPQLVANLPVAIEMGHPTGSLDPKLPLTLILRDMKTAQERALHFEVAGEVTVGELRKATLRRFPVILCRRKVKLFVMGQLLEDDNQNLFQLRGIYAGATVNFMPGERIADPVLATTPKKKKTVQSFLDELGSSDSSSSEEEAHAVKSKSAPATRLMCKQGSRESREACEVVARQMARRASSLEAPKRTSVKKSTSMSSSTSSATPKAAPKVQACPKKEAPVKMKMVSWLLPNDHVGSEDEAAIVPASRPCTLLSQACEMKTLHFWLHI